MILSTLNAQSLSMPAYSRLICLYKNDYSKHMTVTSINLGATSEGSFVRCDFFLFLQYVSGPHGTYTQMAYPQTAPMMQHVTQLEDHNSAPVTPGDDHHYQYGQTAAAK